MGMLDGLRRRDPAEFHRFLWSNHLAYAETYEIPRRFGASKINPTRHILFDRIVTHLRSRGVNPARDIRSVFEIGCSMGYLLRHLEEQVFPSAPILHGLDIDRYAIQSGAVHLSALGSRVRLFAADMAASGRVMGSQNYDLVLCCGVLMYANETIAEEVLRAMLSHTDRLVGLICLAPEGDHARSRMRSSDGAFIHNVDKLISGAGGAVLSSDFIGASLSGSSPSHVIVAEPCKPKPRLVDMGA
jgi:SAM-dependent methyltransferase